jgi:hypothetical protein
LEHKLYGICTVPNCNTCSKTEQAEEEYKIIKKGNWQEPEHALTSWAFCCHNKCPTHQLDKEGAGWFPQLTKQICCMEHLRPVQVRLNKTISPDNKEGGVEIPEMDMDKSSESLDKLTDTKEWDKLTSIMHIHKARIDPSRAGHGCMALSWLVCWEHHCPTHMNEKMVAKHWPE